MSERLKNASKYWQDPASEKNLGALVARVEARLRSHPEEGEGWDVIAIRPMCYVTLTIDHRVLDGYQTNTFLAELVDTLEHWPQGPSA